MLRFCYGVIRPFNETLHSREVGVTYLYPKQTLLRNLSKSP